MDVESLLDKKIPLGLGEKTLKVAELIILIIMVIVAWKQKPKDYWGWLLVLLAAVGFVIW